MKYFLSARLRSRLFLLGNLGNCELTRARSRQREPSGAARILEWCSASCSFPSVQSTQEITLYPMPRFPKGPSVCRSAAFGVSRLAEGSSPSEFGDAIGYDRQIEVVGIE